MTKFACDQMLGTLATWLRILGFDTYYASAALDDDMLINLAEKEFRILITRDKQIIQKMNRKNLPVIEVQVTKLDDQLQQVLKDVTFTKKDLLSRCSLCNTLLHTVTKDTVVGMVPPKVFEYNNLFLLCPTCNKVYWKGSHYTNITKKIAMMNIDQS